MGKYLILALATIAAPAVASSGGGDLRWPERAPVDILYPEIPLEEEAWRGLLPVILLDNDKTAERPAADPETPAGKP